MTTFRRSTVVYNEADDTSSTVVTTIAGEAIQVRGRPETYRALQLVESNAPTLLFTPSDYALPAGSDAFVRPGDTVEWAGESYTVRDVDPVAPDGEVIIARIVIVR